MVDDFARETAISEKCPQYGSPCRLEKWLKTGHVAVCPNPECKYKHELAGVEAATPA